MVPPYHQANYINDDDYKDLFDNSHDLIHLVDLTGKIIYINKSWAELTGYTAEEIAGQDIYSLIRESDRASFINYREKIIHGEPDNRQVMIGLNLKNGKTAMLEGGVSLRKKEGQPVYTRGIFRDISSRIESESQLKEREYYTEQLLINAPDAVVVINHESRITFWNPKAEMIFGWTSAEVLGSSLTDKIIPHKYREAHAQGMKRYLMTGEANVLNKTIEITAINKAGTEFNISLTISNTAQNGNPVFIAFLRDISVQKKNEAELENRRKQLEVSNEQLQQFAHVASHDMKEPVRKIMLFSEQLEKEFGKDLPEQAQSFLNKIHRSAGRIRNIIDGFLNYATVNSIQQAYQSIDLGVIIKNMENDLELLIAEKKAKIIYEDLPRFEGVPFLIYQLFYNLVYNSLKFSHKNIDPVISISGKIKNAAIVKNNAEIQPGSDYAEIKVKDNGIGFTEENAVKIFKTFVRLNSKNEYEGNGLGLTLCKNIAERHNGFISAEATPHAGAVFTVLLPVYKPGK